METYILGAFLITLKGTPVTSLELVDGGLDPVGLEKQGG